MSCEDYDALAASIGGSCQVCATPFGEQVPQIDHDPEVGPWAVRGMLCTRCNTGLGSATDDRVARYLADPWYIRADRIPDEPTIEDHLTPGAERYAYEIRIEVARIKYEYQMAMRRRVEDRDRELRRIAADFNLTQAELAKATGYSRETIRQAFLRGPHTATRLHAPRKLV